MNTLRIGQVAERSGVNVETLRYYERKGLIPAPPRTDAGYRLYPEDTVERLAFIQHAKTLRFTLREIRILLDARDRPAKACEQLQALVSGKVSRLADEERRVRKARKTLEGLRALCTDECAEGRCPLLGAIASGCRSST